ncbi:unnamed protein product, partial [Acidithrix sp. C25]
VEFASSVIDGRRLVIVDGAITVLGSHGSRWLTHRAVDQLLGLPEGSTSNYYRTRQALEAAIFVRVCEVDIISIRMVHEKASLYPSDGQGALAIFRDLLSLTSTTQEGILRQRARLEVFLAATNRPNLFELVNIHRREMREALGKVLEAVGLPLSASKLLALEAFTQGLIVDACLHHPKPEPLVLDEALSCYGEFFGALKDH